MVKVGGGKGVPEDLLVTEGLLSTVVQTQLQAPVVPKLLITRSWRLYQSPRNLSNLLLSLCPLRCPLEIIPVSCFSFCFF